MRLSPPAWIIPTLSSPVSPARLFKRSAHSDCCPHTDPDQAPYTHLPSAAPGSTGSPSLNRSISRSSLSCSNPFTLWHFPPSPNSSLPNTLCSTSGRLALAACSSLTPSAPPSEVSYYASCTCLSNKGEFPTFFRTIPSDAVQIKAIVRLLQHFRWTWVGAVAEDNDYGRFGMMSFIQEVARSDICISFIEFISATRTEERILEVVNTIKTSTAKVVIIFCGEVETPLLVKELRLQNISDIQLIASEAWITSFHLWTEETDEILFGTLGFGIRKAEIPGLREFLVTLHPSTASDNPFVEELWEEVFGCSVNILALSPGQSESMSLYTQCTGSESLENTETIYTDVSQLRVSYNVYKAVYAIAHALHNLLLCEDGKGPFANKTCGRKSHIEPWQVRPQILEDGSLQLVKVGYYDASLSPGEELVLDEGRVPVSACSQSCVPGTRKALQEGQPICCFDCLPCADGEISNQTDATECIKCPVESWSNGQNDECVPKEIEFLSFQDTMGITLTVISLSGACIT
uniref:Olfactory receptor C family, x3 n=1 Tax=Callorhinchus milii TaxID=7868 RepID=A0A4W3H0B3_CALMI